MSRVSTASSRPGLHWGGRLLVVLGLMLMLLPLAPRRAAAVSPDRYFPATGYSIQNDAFWNYYQRRGGLNIFGYPVSREFLFLGLRTQFFQRLVMQQRPDGGVQTMNLLDEGLMPYTRINESTFPEVDAYLKAQTPTPDDPDYGRKIVEFVRSVAPDFWNGYPVNFGSTFFNTVSYEDAFPFLDGDPALMPLIDLEIWGAPTSYPQFDPRNRNFVYQRFQRGIMHYDNTCRCTQGLLLADYFKAIITGQNLPPDLADQARGSRFFQQYDNGQPGGMRRPWDLPNSNLQNAFEPDYGQDYVPNLTPVAAQPPSQDEGGGGGGGGDRPEARLEAPTSGQFFGGAFTVQGWARDDDGIRRVEIWIDGQHRANADYGFKHNDPDCNCGFRYRVDPAALGLAPGEHELSVRVVDRDGDTRRLGPRTFRVLAQPQPQPDYAVEWRSYDFPTDLAPASRYNAHVSLRNLGTMPWFAGGPNPVRLSYHWLTSDGQGVVLYDGLRTGLPFDVPAGGTVDLNVTVQTPDQPGTYVLQLDLVHEGVTWFSQRGAATASLTREVRGRSPFAVEWQRVSVPQNLLAGQTYDVDLAIRNASSATWAAGGSTPVRVSYHWYSADGTQVVVWDGLRTNLPGDVRPGDSVQLTARVRTPDQPGDYRLVFDLLQDNVAWFSRQGAATSDHQRRVGAPSPFAVEWQRYDLPSTLRVSQDYTARVRIRNASNVTWPAGGPNPVRLSYHWYDENGENVVVWEGRRTALPYDLGPNETVELDMAVRTPDDRGTYTIVFDLVQDGVAWFSRQGAATASLRRDIRSQQPQAPTPVPTVAPPAPQPGYTVEWIGYSVPGAMAAGQTYPVHVIVRNLGGIIWPALGDTPVRLSYHWLSPAGDRVVWEGMRTALPSDIPPGGTVDVWMHVRAPDQPGSYVLQLDLVQTNVTWFSLAGAQAPTTPREIAPRPAVSAEFQAMEFPAAVQASQTYQAHVVAANTGTDLWNAAGDSRMRIGYHWLNASTGEPVVWDGLRTNIPVDVPPGGVLDVQLAVRTPDQPGRYVLQFDLVREGITWYSRQGTSAPVIERFVGP